MHFRKTRPKLPILDGIIDAVSNGLRPFLMTHTKHFLRFPFFVGKNIFLATNLGWPCDVYTFYFDYLYVTSLMTFSRKKIFWYHILIDDKFEVSWASESEYIPFPRLPSSFSSLLVPSEDWSSPWLLSEDSLSSLSLSLSASFTSSSDTSEFHF